MVKLVFNKVTEKWDLFLNGRRVAAYKDFQKAFDMALHTASLVERGFIE